MICSKMIDILTFWPKNAIFDTNLFQINHFKPQNTDLNQFIVKNLWSHKKCSKISDIEQNSLNSDWDLHSVMYSNTVTVLADKKKGCCTYLTLHIDKTNALKWDPDELAICSKRKFISNSIFKPWLSLKIRYKVVQHWNIE